MATLDIPSLYGDPLAKLGKRMRDLGWYQVEFPKFLTTVPMLMRYGIDGGDTLEIGSGAAYLGLEWLKSVDNSTLIGLDISHIMVEIARQNAVEYGFTDRARYMEGDSHNLPFKDECFDCVFANASLHEWNNPINALNEIHRVLKVGGRFYIADIRHDISKLSRKMIEYMSPKELKPYYIASFKQCYSTKEVVDMIQSSPINKASVHRTWYGLIISGGKA